MVSYCLINNQKRSDFFHLLWELGLTKHMRLNLERSPCEEDPNYSFSLCVKESLAQQVKESIVCFHNLETLNFFFRANVVCVCVKGSLAPIQSSKYVKQKLTFQSLMKDQV